MVEIEQGMMDPYYFWLGKFLDKDVRVKVSGKEKEFFVEGKLLVIEKLGKCLIIKGKEKLFFVRHYLTIEVKMDG